MVKTLLIIQPGRFGDIIICLPMAKYYHDKGYKVEWLCPKEYHALFSNISYCTPVTQITKNYYDLIDISFGFNGAPELWWQVTQPRWKSFIEPKYYLAKVPLEERWKLEWDRDTEAEDLLFNKLTSGKPYRLIHESGSSGETKELYQEGDVVFGPQEGFNIFDWYKIICEASEIHVVDSFLFNFVEVIEEVRDTSKYYYNTPRSVAPHFHNILKNGWTIYD